MFLVLRIQPSHYSPVFFRLRPRLPCPCHGRSVAELARLVVLGGDPELARSSFPDMMQCAGQPPSTKPASSLVRRSIAGHRTRVRPRPKPTHTLPQAPRSPWYPLPSDLSSETALALFPASHQPSAKKGTRPEQISTRPKRHKEGENTISPETYHLPQPPHRPHHWPRPSPVTIPDCGQQLTPSRRRSITSLVLSDLPRFDFQLQPLVLDAQCPAPSAARQLSCKYLLLFRPSARIWTLFLALPTRRRRVYPSPRLRVETRPICVLARRRLLFSLYPAIHEALFSPLLPIHTSRVY